MKAIDRIKVEHLEHRKMLCRRHGLDPKKVEDLQAKIMVLLEKAVKKDRTLEMFHESIRHMRPVLHSVKEIEELAEVKNIPKKKRLLIELFYYLGGIRRISL